MRIGLFMASAACVVVVACGGAGSGATTATVVVPAQPPQPVATVAPPVTPDAGAPVVAEVAFECKTGQRFEIGARSYCAYTDPLPWDAAEHRCVENGGHLATIDSRATSQAMKKALGSPASLPRAAWIGLELSKIGKMREWRWSNGAQVRAPSWSVGEPNDFFADGSEACGEWLVADGKWNDTRCDLRLPVLCQYPAKPEAPCENSVTEAGVTYCIDAQPRSFADAKKACIQKGGGTIAGPIPEAVNESLKKALAARFGAKRFWIGLSDVADEGAWTWSSGARFEFREWQRGEPNDYLKEDCVEVYADTWTWNDFDCTAPKASVCESPPKKK